MLKEGPSVVGEGSRSVRVDVDEYAKGDGRSSSSQSEDEDEANDVTLGTEGDEDGSSKFVVGK